MLLLYTASSSVSLHPDHERDGGSQRDGDAAADSEDEDPTAGDQHRPLIHRPDSPKQQPRSHASRPLSPSAIVSALGCLPRFLLSLPLRLRLLALLTLVLLVDHFVRPPHGLFRLRTLLSLPTHAPPAPCGWDYEASWRIGLLRGSSPLTLLSQHRNTALNPIFTCAAVPSPPVSFVADPFLLITDAATQPLPLPLHDQQPAASPAAAAAPTRYFLFFEMKNLLSMKGEIGVARSDDELRSFAFLGTALSEPFHLSYPLPLYHSATASFLLMPECSATSSVRIYSTAAADFPLGWRLHSSPLTGRRYVDTSPVFYRGLWFVFTTADSALFLFTTPDLLDAVWTPHPLSPLLSSDRRISRSAGRPFVHDGRVVRLAQDDSDFYGSAVYMLEVEELTPFSYAEREAAVITPEQMQAQGQAWAAARVHHADVKRLPDGSWLAVVDGDDKGDDYEFWQREGAWKRGKDIALLLLIAAFSILATAEWRRRRPQLPLSPLTPALRRALLSPVVSRLPAVRLPSWRQSALLLMRFIAVGVVVFAAVILHISPAYDTCAGSWSGSALPCALTADLQRQEQTLSLPLPPDVSARFNLSASASLSAVNTSALLQTLATVAFPDSAASFPLPPLPPHPPLPSLPLPSSSPFPQQYLPFPGFALVTAASSSYFDRLQNFVGSLHYWEPQQRLLVFDLGLTEQQLQAARCWQAVELLPFPFHVYPAHVRNLYNYAWKLLMLEQAFSLPSVSAVLVLDSGVELRAPHALSDIKRRIMERGYWLALQSNEVDKKTLPAMLHQLGVELQQVAGKPFCAGGLHGFLRHSAAYRDVVLPAVRCAKDESCIAPAGSGRQTHNFDQSALSALVYATGRSCDGRRAYREWDMSLSTQQETDFNADVVLSLRRWHQPKPYIRHITQTISAACVFVPSIARAALDFPPSPALDVLAVSGTEAEQRAQLESLLIQHNDGLHLEDDSPLVQCLRRHANSRYECRQQLHDHQQAIVSRGSRDGDPAGLLDSLAFPLLRRIRCVNNWALTVALTCLCCYAIAGGLRFLAASWLRIALTAALLLCIALYPAYIALLNEYGTFSPLAVWYLTSLHSPSSPYPVPSFSPSSSPPSRPPFRLVFSLSTLPHQVQSINETLSSLSSQLLRPDAIHVNLPFVNRRTNTSYSPPAYLLSGSWEGVQLTVNRGEDRGPLTKLSLTLQQETEPSTLIITVDSDKLYPASLSLTLAHHAMHEQRAAFGVCGWSFLFRPAPVGVLPVYVPWSLRGRYGREVDVLQAVCGNAYRRSFFPAVGSAELTAFSSPHPHCFTTDDLWIAGWLSTRAGVRKVLVPGGWSMWDAASPEPSTAQWKRELNEKEKQEAGGGRAANSWELSSINKAAGVDLACIRGVEQTLGPWRALRG